MGGGGGGGGLVSPLSFPDMSLMSQLDKSHKMPPN